MVKITEYQDKYNENKVWVVKKTDCRHYFLNQKINGKFFYPKYQRVSLDFIRNILG